jgi:hypothetical protein
MLEEAQTQNTRLDVLTVVKIEIAVFWDMTSYPEDEGSMFPPKHR